MAGFNLTAQINLRGPGNVKKVVAGIQKQLNGLNANVNLNLNKNTVKTLSDANKKLLAINSSLNKVSSSASKANTAVAQFANTINSIGTGNVSVKIQNASKATQQLGKNAAISFKNIKIARTEIEEFGRQSALAIRRFTAFASVTSVIYGVNNAINQALSDFIKFDRQLVRIAQVSGQTAGNLKGLQSTISQLATGIGVSSSSLAEISVTLTQAGFSIRDVQKALKALALTDVAPTFNNLNDTVEGSIALLRQFSISAGDLESSLGSINAVAAKFAVESSDIISAIQRAGGVFAAASRGVSEGTQALNEFIAIFTSVRSTTREGAETIATGLRTIFTRIQRESTIDALKEFGVNLQDAEGKFVGAFRAVELLSKGLSSLDPRDIRFGRIVEELGGFRQIGKVIPLISQFATAQDALKVAQQGQDSLAKSNAVAQQALAIQFARVREEFLKLVRDVAGTDSFKGLVSGALSLASALIKVADAVKGVLPILGLFAAAKGASAIGQFAKGFGGGLRRTQGFARGGTVPGSGNTDSVPAMLTPGEFVLRKSAVKSIGTERLHRMNNYAYGGTVEQLGKIYSSIPKKPGYEKIKNRKIRDKSVFKKIKPTKEDLNLWNSMKLPYGERFERILSAKIPGIGKPDSYKYAFLDFPDARAEAKFMKRGQTYNQGENDQSKKGNTSSSIAAKNLLYENSLISGNANKKVTSLSTYSLANKPVTTYWADPSEWTKKALGGSSQDTVPAVLTPGEFVFNKESASRIGYGNLRKMNTRPQGFNKGGVVGFANGGLTSLPGRSSGISFGKDLTSQLAGLEQAFNSMNLPVDQLTRAVMSNGKVSYNTYKSLLRQSKANIDLAKSSAKTSDDLKKVEAMEKQLMNIRRQAAGQLRTSKSGALSKASQAVSGEAGFYTAAALTTLAVAAESSGTALGSGLAGAATSLAASLALVQGVSSTIPAVWGLIAGVSPGVAAGLTAMLAPLLPFAAAAAAVVAGLALLFGGITAYNSYKKKEIELAKKASQTKLDTATDRAAKAMEKFNKEASNANFQEVNRAIADQLSAGQDFAKARTRQTENEAQGTGFFRELGAYLTFGYVDSIEEATQNNEGRVKAAAKEIVEANSEAFQNAQNVVFQQFAKGRTLRDLQSAAPGTEESKALDNLVNAALAADQTYQEQVAIAAQQGKQLTQQQIDANKARIRSELFAADGSITLKDKLEQASRAQERLGRLQARLATSFERLNNVVQQSINRIELEAEARQSSIDSIIAAARGQASITEIRSRAANVVENPLAYTPQERSETRRNLTANLTPALGERRAKEVSALATFDPAVIEKSFTDVANNVAVSAKPSEVGEQIRENLQLEIDKLRAAGAEDTARALQEQANATATIIAGKLEGVSDPVKRQQIIDESLEQLKKGFNETRDNAVNLAKQFEETRTNALNRFAKNLAEVAQLQNEALKYEQAAINANRNIADSISEAVTGFGPSINELLARQQADTARLTGGPTDPAAIKRNFDALRASSELLQSQLDDAAAAGDTAEAERLATRLTEVNRELNNNRQALEQLAESASKAAEAALAEVNERKRLQDANKAFAETLLSSGPDELKKLDEALVRANQRVNGFIPQAGASQRKRFFELLKQTGSVQQASQGVAAETRAEDLKFLQQTRDLRIEQMIQSGMSREAATQRANQDESRILAQMGGEAGLGVLGRQIVGRAVATTADRRNDPVMRELINEYQQAAQVQAQANEQLSLIASGAANEALVASQNTLRETIDNLNSTISGSDQRSRPDGIDPFRGQVAAISKGGMIYASDGQYINFEPRGTDTVPAMLTPGEFVVNRQATQKNMGLLQAINSGNINGYSNGGKVAYLAGGGFAKRDTNKDGVITVGVEDSGGLNDSNNDGTITFAEFMNTQSVNDPKMRDAVNKINQRLTRTGNIQNPSEYLANEQFVDMINTFGPIVEDVMSYASNPTSAKEFIQKYKEYRDHLNSFGNTKDKAAWFKKRDEFLKDQAFSYWASVAEERGPKEVQTYFSGISNGTISAPNILTGSRSLYDSSMKAYQKKFDEAINNGMTPEDAQKQALDFIYDPAEGTSLSAYPETREAFTRMTNRATTARAIRGGGGTLTRLRASHQKGIQAAIRARKNGQDPQKAYFEARNNYLEEQAKQYKDRKLKSHIEGRRELSTEEMKSMGYTQAEIDGFNVDRGLAMLQDPTTPAGKMLEEGKKRKAEREAYDNARLDELRQQYGAERVDRELAIQNATADATGDRPKYMNMAVGLSLAMQDARKADEERQSRRETRQKEWEQSPEGIRFQQELEKRNTENRRKFDEQRRKDKEKRTSQAISEQADQYLAKDPLAKNILSQNVNDGTDYAPESLRLLSVAPTTYVGTVSSRLGDGIQGPQTELQQSRIEKEKIAASKKIYDQNLKELRRQEEKRRKARENYERSTPEWFRNTAEFIFGPPDIQNTDEGKDEFLGALVQGAYQGRLIQAPLQLGSGALSVGRYAVQSGLSGIARLGGNINSYFAGRAQYSPQAERGGLKPDGLGIDDLGDPNELANRTAQQAEISNLRLQAAGSRISGSILSLFAAPGSEDTYNNEAIQIANELEEKANRLEQDYLKNTSNAVRTAYNVADIGADFVLDPATYIGVGAASKAFKALDAAEQARVVARLQKLQQAGITPEMYQAAMNADDIPLERAIDIFKVMADETRQMLPDIFRKAAKERKLAEKSFRDKKALEAWNENMDRLFPEEISDAIYQPGASSPFTPSPSTPKPSAIPLEDVVPTTRGPVTASPVLDLSSKQREAYNALIDAGRTPDEAIMMAEQFKKGGVVYASNGALIGFKSRGTDTVPAMLTPGEFVVNREATSKFLPVLRSINSGYDNHNQMVNHLARGGIAGGTQYLQQGGITQRAPNNGVSVNSQIQGIEELKAVVNEFNQAVSIGTENMNNVATQVTSATTQFASTAQSINTAAVNIPDSVNVAQNVRVDGIPESLNGFSTELLNSSVAQSTQQTSQQFNDLNTKNEGALGLPSPNNNAFIT